MKNTYGILLLCSILQSEIDATHTRHKPLAKELFTRWIDDDVVYTEKTHHADTQHLFHAYNKAECDAYALPKGPITYRNNHEKTIQGQVIYQDIARVIEQLRAHEPITQFTVLKDAEFNYHEVAGLLVLKSNTYPFVVKLFCETPKSFLRPADKGFRHACMARMTNGLTRYLSGFGRIKNCAHIRHLLTQHPEHQLDLPRKWFVLPEGTRFFELVGHNFDTKPLRTELPACYAIVADEIASDISFRKLKRDHSKDILHLCQTSNFCIDPNRRNFCIEKGTGKLVLIDTEHFSQTLGFKTKLHASSYQGLHIKMAAQFLSNFLFA